MQVERPIDVQATRILGLEIEKLMIESPAFRSHEKPFKYFTLKRDEEQCIGIDVSTIATAPRKGSHFYSIMMMLPKSLKEKYPDYLGEENMQQHFLLHNAITSTMSRYSEVVGVNVRKGQPAEIGAAKAMLMSIRLKAAKMKAEYPDMLERVEQQIVNYKKQLYGR